MGKERLFCTGCGQELPSAAKFCPGCGARAYAREVEETPIEAVAAAMISEPSSEEVTLARQILSAVRTSKGPLKEVANALLTGASQRSRVFEEGPRGEGVPAMVVAGTAPGTSGTRKMRSSISRKNALTAFAKGAVNDQRAVSADSD